MKKLILYYSLDGNTKAAAASLGEMLGADICGIEPVKPVSGSQFAKIMTGGMQVTFGLRPAIKPLGVNPEDYDEIILGMPVWAGKPAAPIRTVLKKYAVGDKVQGVFTFSGSGNNEGCLAKLKTALPAVKHTANLIDKNCDGHEKNDEKLMAFAAELNQA